MKHLLLTIALICCTPLLVRAEDPATAPANTAPEPVDFRKLKETLPEKLGGLERTSAEGQRIKQAQVHISQVSGKYGKDEGDSPKIINVNIIDYAATPDTAKGLASWEQMEMDMEGDSGFTKVETINGRRVLLTYTTEAKTGSASFIINKRLMVQIMTQELSADDFKAAVKDFPADKFAEIAPEVK